MYGWECPALLFPTNRALTPIQGGKIACPTAKFDAARAAVADFSKAAILPTYASCTGLHFISQSIFCDGLQSHSRFSVSHSGLVTWPLY